MSLDLLLAGGRDGTPVLPRGLSLGMLSEAPLPEWGGTSEKWLWDGNRDPNDLLRQRWGLVAPEGPVGDRLLALVEPLKRARQEAQGGAPVRVYRVASPDKVKMDGKYAVNWKKYVFLDEAVPEPELPRYLLLLGDLDQIPVELQQVLSINAFVGRLAFASEQGYEAYVAKVLQWEREPSREARARMLFYTARDGTAATENGHEWLMKPSASACRSRQQDGGFPQAEILELVNEGGSLLEQLQGQALQPAPGVLLTLSHGLGHGPQASNELRAMQGALVLPGGRRLTGAEVASGAFLPGGVWFSFACFSAGTPARSSYAHWLRQLQAPQLDALADPLPQGAKPFISALPQAALANPQGPLAVIGHVDLAWSYSFNDQGLRRTSRYLGVLKTLAEGGRVGVALQALLRYLNETSIELTIHYNTHALGGSQRPPGPERWAELWMLHQDLANFILLGDPAVRLPLAPPAAVARVPERVVAAPAPAPAPAPRMKGPPEHGASPLLEPAVAEKWILALLSGKESAEAIAAGQGISPQELRRWAEVYRSAGLVALAKERAQRM